MAQTYREFFGPILRDGAGQAEVMQTMLDGLQHLTRTGDAQAATALITHLRDRAERALDQDWERALLD